MLQLAVFIIAMMLHQHSPQQVLPRGIMFYEGFESSRIGKGWQAFEYGSTDNMELVSDIKRAGNQSARILLRRSDPEAQWGNKRTELTYNNFNQASKVDESLRWYAFSNYFPASYAADPAEEVIAQFHDKSTRCSASPTLALEVADDRFRLMIRHSLQHYCDPGTQVLRSFDLGPVPKEQWIDWVIYYNPVADSSGVVRIWMNGEEKITYNGPCHYNGSRFPYFKIGLYKWQWMQDWQGVQSNQIQRIYYLDEIRIGDIHATPEAFGLKVK